MSDIHTKHSQAIDILKCVLPILVVAIHTSNSAELDFHNGLEPFLRILIVKIGSIAVPCFFVISGYLFFMKLQEWNWNDWGKKIKKRARTLLIPFLLWIIIDFVAKYLWGVMKSEIDGFSLLSFKTFFFDSGGLRMFWDRPLVEYNNSLLGYLVDSSKPIDGPLWYVRDLMVMVLFAPLIWKMLKSTRYYALAALCAIYLFFIGFPFVLVSPIALFFFSFGASFSISGKDFLEVFRSIRFLSYSLSVILLALSFIIEGPVWGELITRMFVVVSVVALFNLVSDLYDKGQRPAKLLTDSSFFIYASHTVLITEISNFILWRALPIMAEWMLVLKVFLRPAVTVGLCLLLFVIMKKICPKTLSLLTGGRG